MARADLLRLMALFSAGRHAEMEAAAQMLVQQHPQDGQAWKALGVALLAQRKDAAPALTRATSLLPGDVEVASNLGHVLAVRGDLQGAANSYRRAINIHPSFAQAHAGLSDVLARQGQWTAAESSGRQSVDLDPALAAGHLSLANALRGQGRNDEAIVCYQRSLTISPNLAEAHLALGIALKSQGLLAQAQASLLRALQLKPALAQAHDQLGVVLHATGQLDAAATSLRKALALSPEMPGAQFHLGNVLVDQGQFGESLLCFEQALQQQPDQIELQVNRALALLNVGRIDDAVEALRRVVAARPDLALVHSNLGNALMLQGKFTEAAHHHALAVAAAPDLSLVHSNQAHLLKSMGRPELALDHLCRARALQPDRPSLHSEVLFVQNYLPPGEESSRVTLDDARSFGQLTERLAQPFSTWPNPPTEQRTLRIGLVSGDLRNHPVGYFLQPVLSAWAGSAAHKVDVFAYANQRQGDALTQALRSKCRQWHDVADMDDATLAVCIRADGIDVLIDLAGHTRHNRLPMFAWRPAPVQVSWLGYCATTGMAAIDAFMGDPWITPAGCELVFVERIVRLPETFLCFTPPTVDLPVGPLPAMDGTGVRFACFNQLAKIGDAVISLWARVLHAVPGSTLALQAQALQDDGVRQLWIARFARLGIDSSRLHLRPAQDRASYLAAYGQVDIVLDTFPYPGGTTSFEALWMGVPVLTLAGPTALGRQGVSILNNLGLCDWVAASELDYIALACRHAEDLSALSGLRQTLRERLLKSPLCDAARFASDLESALRALWRDWCRRQGDRSAGC